MSTALKRQHPPSRRRWVVLVQVRLLADEGLSFGSLGGSMNSFRDRKAYLRPTFPRHDRDQSSFEQCFVPCHCLPDGSVMCRAPRRRDIRETAESPSISRLACTSPGGEQGAQQGHEVCSHSVPSVGPLEALLAHRDSFDQRAFACRRQIDRCEARRSILPQRLDATFSVKRSISVWSAAVASYHFTGGGGVLATLCLRAYVIGGG